MALRGSFAAFLIVCPTCFFLGIIFSLFPYDYPLLWSTVPTPASHYDYLEAHLRFLHNSPPLIPRILHIVIAVGLIGLIMKLYKPTESNMLFDGASLVLYMCGVIVYIANIVKGLRIVTEGDYGASAAAAAATAADTATGGANEEGSRGVDQILSREDSMKVLSASNTILALVLVGVLILQAGQWYAEKKEQQEADDINNKEKEREKGKEKEKENGKEKEKERNKENEPPKAKETPARVTRQSSSSKKRQ
ncbi:hypothetical protein FQN57_003015 [Myotisia sp. PD_48]|nr:hypothetical protein FQN57_003015 [Myotisia sp. PD_48]